MSGYEDFDRAQASYDALGPDDDDGPTLRVEPTCWCGMNLTERPDAEHGFCAIHGPYTPPDE